MNKIFHGLRNSNFINKLSRPNTLDELSYQFEVISALKNIVKSGNVNK